MLAFVIPLRHPIASKSWPAVIDRLQETLRSVAACAASGKAFAVLVANRDAVLPPVPQGVTVLRVDYPPPAGPVFRGEATESARKEAVFIDKGSKVAFGAIHARNQGASYVMPVDADDLVSSRLPEFVAEHHGPAGWQVRRGWLLPVGARYGLILGDFDQWCGTSMIVRADLLGLEDELEQMDPTIVKRWFGHHREMIPDLVAAGHTIDPVPFLAAVYRTGHTEGNYKRGSLLEDVFTFRKFRDKPIQVVKKLRWLRRFGPSYVDEFHRGAALG